MVLDTFAIEKYSINNVQNYYKTMAYIQAILYYTKSTEIDSTLTNSHGLGKELTLNSGYSLRH